MTYTCVTKLSPSGTFLSYAPLFEEAKYYNKI